jgi:fructokinase
MNRIGIDLGGTKIEIVALSPDGEQLLRRRVPTPADDYAAIVDSLVALVRGAENDVGPCTVGIGTPGAVSLASGLIKNSNSLCLNGKPLKQDLERLLQREIRIMNDANCFALSEATDGGGAGGEVVFGVIIGTGVGGGVVVGGRPLVGVNAIAGEWGHNPLPLDPAEDLPLPRCKCGRMGCVEAFLSGPSFAYDHGVRTGEQKLPADIVKAAAHGDAGAAASIDRYERRLARALAIVINIIDPDVIVLGGGMSNVERLYENVPRHWVPHVFSDRVDTRLARHRHGDSSGVRGAAWLWNDRNARQ